MNTNRYIGGIVMIKTFIFSFFSLFLIGCPVQQEPRPTPKPKDTDMCMAAEKKLETLKCTNRDDTPMWINKLGEPFNVTCTRIQREGGIFLNPPIE